MRKITFIFCAAALIAATTAWAAGQFTAQLPNSATAYGAFTGVETIPVDTNLPQGAQPQTVSSTLTNLATFVNGAAGVGLTNGLRGGDFTTNLFQRGTSATGITTTATYSADGWAIISGTSTSAQWSKQTGASDITTGMNAALRVQRTSGQTGVVPVCVGQVLTSAESTRFQGKTVVFQFLAKYGANFSAASSNVTATISYGTGSDESAANFFAGTWTGQANVVSTTFGITDAYVPATPYKVSGAVPATATQVGVKICYTPVGTASTNDWFEFGLAALTVNAAGTAVTFPYTSAAVEAARQYQFLYRVTETAAVTPFATCAVSTTSLGICLVPFPVPMRAVPTMSFTTGFAMTVAAQTSVVTCTGNGTPTAVASTAPNNFAAPVTCTSSAGFGAAGTVAQLFSNGGSGLITASAEL